MAKRQDTQQSKKKTVRHRVLILAVVAAVMVGCLSLMAAWRLVVRKPALPAAPTATPVAGEEEETDPGPSLSGDRKKDFFTFLVVGRDSGGGGNTDTMMVVAYDVPNQTINILNIYRDTMVNVPWEIKRINSVYNGLGIDGLKEHMGKLLGFVPDYYVKVELEAFGELVHAIGGVDFDIPYKMSYDDPTQDLHIHFNKGLQHLDGDDAMRVIRWRKNNDGSGVSVGDIGRVQIQQDFIRALAKQCLKIGNITKVGEFARIFNENVDSDLTLGEMVWFGQQALGMDTDNLAFHTLPGDYDAYAWSRTYQNYQSYVIPFADEIVDLVNEYFNPYVQKVTTDMMDIMSINADGSLSASGGKLADPKAGLPPVKPTKKPEETPEPEESALPKEPEDSIPVESAPPEESPAPEDTGQPTESQTPEESEAPVVLPPEPSETVEALPQITGRLLPAMPRPAAT